MENGWTESEQDKKCDFYLHTFFVVFSFRVCSCQYVVFYNEKIVDIFWLELSPDDIKKQGKTDIPIKPSWVNNHPVRHLRSMETVKKAQYKHLI